MALVALAGRNGNAGSFEWTRGVPPLAHARKGVVILSRESCCWLLLTRQSAVVS